MESVDDDDGDEDRDSEFEGEEEADSESDTDFVEVSVVDFVDEGESGELDKVREVVSEFE